MFCLLTFVELETSFVLFARGRTDYCLMLITSTKGGGARFENEDINEWLAQHSSGVTPVCVEHYQRFLRRNWAAERTQTLVVFTAQTLKHPCDGYSVCVPEEQLRLAATLVDFRRWCFSFRARDLSKQAGVYCSCFLHQTFYKLQQLPVASPWNFVIICIICFCKIACWFGGHAGRLPADCRLKQPFSHDTDDWQCLSSYIQS